MKKLSIEDALILNTAKFARFVVRALPPVSSVYIGRAVGFVLYAVSKRRRIAYRNLRAAFAGEKSRREMKRIARRSIQSVAVSFSEILRCPEMDDAYIRRHIRVFGDEKVRPYIDNGTGIIFLGSHCGNWELLSIIGGLLGYPIVALARRQKHPRSYEFLTYLRSCKGTQVIDKGMSVREIVRALHRGKIVGILSDQDGGKTGTFVKYFGRYSSFPGGAATFAVRTGAKIFPVFIFRRGLLDHEVFVEGPLSMPDSEDPAVIERHILQQYATLIESKIRAFPDQWLWAHRRWKSTPDRFVVVLSDGKTGHLNQSLAVLEALKEERRAAGAPDGCFHSKVITVRFRSAFHRAALKAFSILTGGRLPFGAFWLSAALEKDSFREIMASYADVVVSCGSAILPVNLLAAAENQAKSVTVMKPFVSPRRFSAVIVPRHDKMKKAENVFVTERVLSSVNPENTKAAGAKLLAGLPQAAGRRRIGLLVGGDTETLRFDKNIFEKTLNQLASAASESKALILATSSRRTPGWADELLKACLKSDVCPYLVIANEANPAGTVGAILGASDVVVVSGESMSMVSEALDSGKPVVVFMPSAQSGFKPKYRRFLDDLKEKNMIGLAEVGADVREMVLSRIDAPRVQGSGSGRIDDAPVLREAARRVFA